MANLVQKSPKLWAASCAPNRSTGLGAVDGGESIEGGGEHGEISSVRVPSTDELILTNRAYNKQLYSVLFLCAKGGANSFLICFAGRPGSRQQSDGQAAWRTMGEK